MKKVLVIILCLLLLPLNTYANSNSTNDDYILKGIIEEYTEMYKNCKEFKKEAEAMKISVDELINIKAMKAYNIRKIMLSKNMPFVTAGDLRYANVKLIIQPNDYYCGPTSALQALYALGDEGLVEGTTDAKKMEQLDKDMDCTVNGQTYVYKLAGGLNKYASEYTYSYYPISKTTKKTALKDKISNSLTFDVAPILHAETKYLGYYKQKNYYHFIAVSSINVSTNEIVVKDCNNQTYSENGVKKIYGGTRTTNLDEIYDCLVNSTNPRYLICLTQ